MTMKPSNNIWIRHQQCPCGDWKCYIKYEGEDQTSISSQLVKSETVPSSSLSEAVFTPYVGQIFKSDDDAFEYYSGFARKNGFSIRKARSTESQNLGIYRRDFVCYRSGFNQPRKKANVEHHRERKSVRCGCDAKLYLTKEIVDGVTQWYVSQFSNVHNHELLEDDQVRLLPAYRKIQEADQERILLLSKAGFPVNRIVKVLELEKGVQPGQLPFIEKDVRNFVRTCKKTVQENDALLTEKRENDMQELVEACKAMVEKDADFVYDYTVDENGKFENIAWSYGDSIRAYTVFGDVVTFDTTYRSITYGLLLGVWFGIDNHGNAIFFGCVLLQDESSNSFAWALQAFVRFMRGRHPQTILTDIESGLRDAITRELSDSKHVICIWHVLSKISSWFSFPLGSQYAGFKAEFDILCHLESIEDFERQWDIMVARFGLVSDKHIDLLFSYRASWSLVYIRNYSLARTLTAEFSQSLDSFFKRILNAQTCLQVFFEQVGMAVNLGKLNREGMQYMHIKTCMPIEEHARSILTPYAFNVLQNEIVLSLQYATTELVNGSYLVRHYKKMDAERLVIWMPEDEQIHCSCKEFEHSGILCRHSLRVLAVKNYFQLPPKYFLLRWQIESSLVFVNDQNTQRSSDECAQAFHSVAATLLTESLISKERFDYVHRELIGILEHVKNMPVIEEYATNVADNNVSEPIG
ncbi:FAR1 family protein [Quillaja saponaria]|uniref:Protein FAR1-RELATED SEQUENCE n=1 Tax=Quillaja saponaria TaxID=32244 RepID=A0AAD7LV24_QUISA|nr:FAR1 family protein [Quillaja saponaria]KAJ7964698.1 FAR1 family protein [Quillaja saponaria]